MEKFPKPYTLHNKVHWNTEKSKISPYISTKIDKTLDNSTDQSNSHKIYAYMACMSSNLESPWRDFGDILQLTNWISDSGVTCHMTPDISNFIPYSLVEDIKYIEVADGNFFTAKQTG